MEEALDLSFDRLLMMMMMMGLKFIFKQNDRWEATSNRLLITGPEESFRSCHKGETSRMKAALTDLIH